MHFLGVGELPATPPRPGRSTASLVRDCSVVQRAAYFAANRQYLGFLIPTIRRLWTRLVGDDRPVTQFEADLSRVLGVTYSRLLRQTDK